jgi:hypothetical protein
VLAHKVQQNAGGPIGDHSTLGSIQMARAGTVAVRDPQLPDKIEERRERSAESMLSRQRYFTCTHWMA